MESNEERFAEKIVVSPDDCWLWQAALSYNGYGFFHVGGKQLRAHRWAYENFIGPIPEGMTLDHLCRVRHCANPFHCEIVTRAENALRGDGPTAVNARRTHCIRGHLLADENLRTRPDGRRQCRACYG